MHTRLFKSDHYIWYSSIDIRCIENRTNLFNYHLDILMNETCPFFSLFCSRFSSSRRNISSIFALLRQQSIRGCVTGKRGPQLKPWIFKWDIIMGLHSLQLTLAMPQIKGNLLDDYFSSYYLAINVSLMVTMIEPNQKGIMQYFLELLYFVFFSLKLREYEVGCYVIQSPCHIT